MVSTSEPATGAVGAAAARPVVSYRTNLVTALLGVWFTIGLFVDAWAHNNLARLETFFTPWHALFYSGFAATAAWIAWTLRPVLRHGRLDLRAVPAGYGPTAVALVGFAVAGAGDGTWHTVFGIEQRIDILFSPTHLGLIVTMFVIVTTPVRAMWADRSLPAAPGLLRLLPAVVSTAFATTLVLLFLQYANALEYNSGSVVFALSNADEGFTASLVAALAVTTAVLVAPLLTLARRWRLPFGAATVLYAAVGGLSGATTGFDNWDLIVAFVAAGVGVDLIARWLRPRPRRPRAFRTFATLMPLVTWSVYIAVAALLAPPLIPYVDDREGGVTVHPEAIVELYTGVPMVQGLIGLLIAVLLIPDRRSSRAQDQRPPQPV